MEKKKEIFFKKTMQNSHYKKAINHYLFIF